MAAPAVHPEQPALLRRSQSAPSAPDTLPKLLRARVAAGPRRVAVRYKDLGIWREVDWAEYERRVAAVAISLSRLGVSHGDRVMILSENRIEWAIADLAVEALGAIVAGIYPTSAPAEVEHLLADAAPGVVIVEDQEQFDKVLQVLDRCPSIRHLVAIERLGLTAYRHPLLSWFAALEEPEDPGDLRSAFAVLAEATRPDDISCIIYTSGTTGPPKGAMLSHQNAIAGALALVTGLDLAADDNVVSYLPLCHLAERTLALYVSLLVGFTVSYAESIESVQANIREIAPTIFGAVPRIAQKIRTTAEIKVEESGRLKRASYHFWIAVGRRLARRRLANGYRLGPLDTLVYRLGSLALYTPLKRKFGLHRVRHCIIGTAPVADDLMEYFHAIGVPMRQVYGQTEAGGATHLHPLSDIRVDTVGRGLEGFEWRIAPGSDEVLIRGSAVFKGYWGKPEATREALAGGWLHTGDVGEEVDGQLRIVGRIKDIIITAGGKNISPQLIENKLRNSPYVREAVVVGEGRKYLTALIGVDLEMVGHWAEAQGLPYTTYRDLSERPEVRRLIDDWVEQVNVDLARVEQIKHFRLLPKELDHDDGELTATQKVRRLHIEKAFSDLVVDMYR
jgi:long-chain acyl-CoA synthetase